ncbi:MAG: hypothetical protein WDO15_27030 [Bacteroidota bacterium]
MAVGVKTLQTGTANVTGNLTMTGAVSTATVANLLIGGNLSMGNSTFTANGFTLTINGTTSVGSGGNFTMGSATGAKTFNNTLTIASGGQFTNTVNSNVTFHNGITNNGTFSAGTSGTYTFDTSPQALTGSFVLPNATVTGINLTNNNSLSVTTALSGVGGTVTQASNATLDIGGTSGISNITASAAGNTVTYSGTAQTVHGNNYVNLGLTGSGVKTLQAATTNITGNFTIGGTASATAVGALTIGGNLTLSGGTFVGGAFNHQLAGNWTNNAGSFTSAGSTITFNGASQTIGGSTGNYIRQLNNFRNEFNQHRRFYNCVWSIDRRQYIDIHRWRISIYCIRCNECWIGIRCKLVDHIRYGCENILGTCSGFYFGNMEQLR